VRRSFATAGALLYSFNGHILAQSQHLGVIEIFAWLPLLFLLASKFLRSPDGRMAIWISLVVSILVSIGFLPQATSVIFVFLVFCCAGFLHRPGVTARKLAWLSVAGAIVLCLTAAVTIPLLSADQPMQALGIQGHAELSIFKTLLWPNIFHTWGSYSGPEDATVSYTYAGLLIPILAVFGLFFVPKKAPELAAAFVFSAVAAYTPMFFASGLYALSPFFALIRPINFMYYPVLFGVLLSLLAMERLSARSWMLGLIIAVQAIVTVVPMIASPMEKQDVRIVEYTVIFAMLALVAISVRPTYTGLIGILIAAHLFAVNQKCPLWCMKNRPDLVTPETMGLPNEDLLMMLKNSPEPYRVAIDNHYLGGFWNGSWRIWRIESINGFEPVRSEKYLDTMVRALSDWHTDRLFNVARLDSPLISLLNVRFFVAENDHRPDPLPSQWHLVHQAYWNVYENGGFHPRYAVVPLNSVTVDRATKSATYSPGTARAGSVDSIEKEPGKVKFSAGVQNPQAFLFISERNYRGWEIAVDGQSVEPLTVNGLLMGIPISQGQHVVSLRFRVPYGNFIIVLTILGLCLAAIGFFVGRPRQKEL